MKKLFCMSLMALFLCTMILPITSAAFAEETESTPSTSVDTLPPADQTVGDTTETVPEESDPLFTDEQLDKLAELLKDKVISNTGLTEEDISSLTGKLSEKFGENVSESIIIIIICIVALAVVVGGILIKKSLHLKHSKEQLRTLTVQYNNLMEVLGGLKGDDLINGIASKLKADIDSGAAEEDNAKIIAILQSIYSSVDAQKKAMLSAWGNKVPGVMGVLNEAPSQVAVENLTLYNKKLEAALRSKYGDEADAILASIRKETGV